MVGYIDKYEFIGDFKNHLVPIRELMVVFGFYNYTELP